MINDWNEYGDFFIKASFINHGPVIVRGGLENGFNDLIPRRFSVKRNIDGVWHGYIIGTDASENISEIDSLGQSISIGDVNILMHNTGNHIENWDGQPTTLAP